ncbi:hypothetical protein CF386_09900 [Paraphotobacterium marinum]|uniref:HTH gntR-type domain-containing protein n=1 Tax=Paraphotobacterium marinum TaxID=1755811 RepID=A0A220VGK1_9GAMM|nr:PLP-dependent aminotransferase family protein [Paraphotobacterium marinum]ASK79366.1 hypothetical protein CF386_09900 [Paraphotobacterium marinum]
MFKYQKLFESMEQQIISGYYKYGEKIPSIRMISEKTNLSKNTVINALLKLQDYGYIEGFEKSGFTVSFLNHKSNSKEMLKPIEIKAGKSFLEIMSATSEKMINLGSVHPDTSYPTVKQFFHIMNQNTKRLSNNHYSGYTSPPGEMKLRSEIAKELLLQNVQVPIDEVIITNGATEAIATALMSMTTKGDVIAIPNPCFFGYINIAKALDLKILGIPMDCFQGIHINILEKYLENWPIKAILLTPNFSNPLPCIMSDSHKKKLVSLSQKFDVPIIEVDVFGQLYFNNKSPLLLKSLNPDNVIYISSMSKVFHPDIRLGWCCPGKYLDKIRFMKLNFSIATPLLIQLSVAEFMNKRLYLRHLKILRKSYQTKLDCVITLIRSYWPKDIKYIMPKGGACLWIELPEYISVIDLCKKSKEKNILVVPGSLFTIDDSFQNCIKISYSGFQDTKKYHDAYKFIGKYLEEKSSNGRS